MREVKDTTPDKQSPEYRRPGGPAPESKISPLRGLKQRWTVDDAGTAHRTRADAMRRRATNDLPRLVHI